MVGASAGGWKRCATWSPCPQGPAGDGPGLFLARGLTARSVLPGTSRAGHLPARVPVGESCRTAEILVAPPDHHLVVQDGRVMLTQGPVAAIAPPSMSCFSAAHAIPRVIAVVLSGTVEHRRSYRRESKKGRAGVRPAPERCPVPRYAEKRHRALGAGSRCAGGEVGGALVELVSREAQEVDPPGPPPSSVLLSMEAECSRTKLRTNHRARHVLQAAGYSCPGCPVAFPDRGRWSAAVPLPGGLRLVGLGSARGAVESAGQCVLVGNAQSGRKPALARELAGRGPARQRADSRPVSVTGGILEVLNAASLVRSVIQAGLRRSDRVGGGLGSRRGG